MMKCSDFAFIFNLRRYSESESEAETEDDEMPVHEAGPG